jgi:transcriptional regulator with XRE-family HTH domain
VITGWERLGRRIKAERGRKGYSSVAALARAAGVSPRTVQAIESGSRSGRPREATLAKIERALGWQPGSAERIVEGGRPRQAADPMLERVLAAWPQLSSDQQARIAAQAERWSRA